MSDEEKTIMELYEQYLDEGTIESIKEEDEAEERASGMKLIRKSDNNNYKYDNEDAISIGKYISYFLGLEIYNTSKITHAELKKFQSPYVVTVDNEFADQHPDRVKRGELLIVIDGRGNRGTYINPNSIKQFLNHGDISQAIRTFQKKGIQDLEELDKYWSKCILIQSELDTNQSFLELLMETNKMKRINEIKEYMDLVESIENSNKDNKRR